MSTRITNGRLVSAEGQQDVDIWVADGRVVALGFAAGLSADRTIDVAGQYVLPGCVDVHTHMDLALVGNVGPAEGSDFGGETTADDFASGAIAAAFGGTTTVVDFAEQARGQTLREGVENWHAKLRRAQPIVDVGFHLIVRDLGAGAREEVRSLIADGVTSLKLFLAYKGDLMVDDGVLWEAMELAAELDALIMVHAESGEVIDRLVQRARKAGDLEPRFHASTRPAGTEVEAVGRAIALAEMAGCALYVVHVSTAGSLVPIAKARRGAWPLFAETCTQYLVCDAEDLERPDFEGAKYVFTPPPRGRSDRDSLWRALDRDVLSVVSSDHSPATFEARRRLGGADFSQIPNGAGGVEERLMIVHHHGVNGGRISLSRMVEVLATNPAKLLGLYPKKGSLAVGSDADLVVFDPDREREISASDLHSRCDYSLYDGQRIRGVPTKVMLRGELIVDEGDLTAPPGHGEFVARQTVRRYGDTHIAA